MLPEYSKHDLYFRHYLWNVDRRNNPEAYDIDLQPMDILQGYEVLLFANTFLNLYLPDHTAADLHNVERVLLQYLPHRLTTKTAIAAWLARNLYLIRAAEAPPIYYLT